MKQDIPFNLIQPGTSIKGDLKLSVGAALFGEIDGSINCTSGLVHICEGAIVRGDVSGPYIRIDGRVEGNVLSKEMLEINGAVCGDIVYAGTISTGKNANLGGSIKKAHTVTLTANSSITLGGTTKSGLTSIGDVVEMSDSSPALRSV